MRSQTCVQAEPFKEAARPDALRSQGNDANVDALPKL